MLALVVVVIAASDLRLRREHAEASNLGRAERAEADAVSKLLESYVAHARVSSRSRFAGRRSEGLRAIGEAPRLDVRGAAGSSCATRRSPAWPCPTSGPWTPGRGGPKTAISAWTSTPSRAASPAARPTARW